MYLVFRVKMAVHYTLTCVNLYLYAMLFLHGKLITRIYIEATFHTHTWTYSVFIINVFTSCSQIAESHETRTEQLIVNDNFDLVHKGIQVNERIGDDSLSQHLRKLPL